MNRITRIGIVAVLAVAALLTSQNASAIPLSDLLAGGNIVSGDKEFTNFRNFQSNASGANATPMDPMFIDVTPVVVFGDIGLRFTDDSGNPQMSIGSASGLGTVFEYDVFVLLAGLEIVGNTLTLDASGFTQTIGFPANTGVSVDEVVEDASGGGLATKTVFNRLVNGVNDADTIDSAVFALQPMITVNTDIGLITDLNDPAGAARVDIFTQTFSQIPEPSTFLLLASGLAGLAAWRRRRI